jgi:hypothetical protein
MKPLNQRLIPFSLVLIIALLACGPAATPPATPDLFQLQTQVAQTITALSAVATGPGSTPLPPVIVPSDTPASGATMPPPGVTAVATTPASVIPCDSATFISETIPDGSDFAASTAFTKTWRVRNSGTCTWNTSYAIVFDHGDTPGQEVDLAVNMVAPAAVGTYASYWKFRNSSGVIFVTNPFSAKIDVVPPTPTYTPTATSGWGIIITMGPIIPILLPYTEQVFNQVTIPSGSVGSAAAACPGGSIVTGGGFAQADNMILYTQSQSGNGWQVYAKNQAGSSQLLNAYAICLYNSGGTTSQVYAQVTVSPGSFNNATVSCPAGSVVTGGGYASNTYLTVYNSTMTGNGWQTYAMNNSGSNQLLNAYATCLSGTSATTSQVFAQVSVPAGTSDNAHVSCPSGSLLTGGSFAGSTNLWIYNSSMSSTDSKVWYAYAKNLSGTSQLLNSYAICTTFH